MLDCVIVGAGIAGLAAARSLARRGCTIKLLEARDRVGGRIFNEYTPEGALIEHGGQWVIRGHERVQELVDEYGLTSITLPSGDWVIRLRQTNQRVKVRKGVEAKLNPFEIADVGQALSRLDRLRQRFTKDQVWTLSNQEWLNQALECWIRSNTRIPNARAYLNQVLHSVGVTDFQKTSLKDLLVLQQAGVDLEGYIAVSGDLPMYRTAEGIFKICEGIAKELSDQLVLNAPVAKVAQNDSSVTVTTSDGGMFEAKTVILALAPQLIKTLDFEPALPDWRFAWEGKVPVGNVIKVHMVYPKPWWFKLGLSGQMSSDEGPVQVTFDTSPPDESVGILMGFFQGPDAVGLHKRTRALRERAMAEALARSFGDRARRPIGYYETDWLGETYTQGSHGAHFAPGIWTSCGSSLAEPEGRIAFAGAEYATAFNGYLEGALATAENAAHTVTSQLLSDS